MDSELRSQQIQLLRFLNPFERPWIWWMMVDDRPFSKPTWPCYIWYHMMLRYAKICWIDSVAKLGECLENAHVFTVHVMCLQLGKHVWKLAKPKWQASSIRSERINLSSCCLWFSSYLSQPCRRHWNESALAQLGGPSWNHISGWWSNL